MRERALKSRGFMQLIVHKLLDERLYSGCQQQVPAPFKIFNRLLIADSTTLALPRALASVFPGARNHGASTRQSQLKIQCYYDLLTERIVHFTLASFRQNDQAAPPRTSSLSVDPTT